MRQVLAWALLLSKLEPPALSASAGTRPLHVQLEAQGGDGSTAVSILQMKGVGREGDLPWALHLRLTFLVSKLTMACWRP